MMSGYIVRVYMYLGVNDFESQTSKINNLSKFSTTHYFAYTVSRAVADRTYRHAAACEVIQRYQGLYIDDDVVEATCH